MPLFFFFPTVTTMGPFLFFPSDPLSVFTRDLGALCRNFCFFRGPYHSGSGRCVTRLYRIRIDESGRFNV